MTDTLARGMAYMSDGDRINAKAWAKGDGVTDDSAAFFAAVASANALGKREIFFPPGVYRIKDVALNTAQATDLRLRGVPKKTVFKNVGGARILSIASGAPNFAMDGIDLDSDAAGIYVAVGHAASASTRYDHNYRQVRILRMGATSAAIQYAREVAGAYFEGLTFTDCEVLTGRLTDTGGIGLIKLQSTGPLSGGLAARVKVLGGFYHGGTNRTIFDLTNIEGFQATGAEFLGNNIDYLLNNEIESWLSHCYHKGSRYVVYSQATNISNLRLEGVLDGAGQSYSGMYLAGGAGALANNIHFGMNCIIMPRSAVVIAQPITGLKISALFRAVGDATTYPVIDVQATGVTKGTQITGCTFDTSGVAYSRRVRITGVATGLLVSGNTALGGTDTFLDLGAAAHVSGLVSGNVLEMSTATAFSADDTCNANVKWDSSRNVYPGQAISAGGATVLA